MQALQDEKGHLTNSEDEVLQLRTSLAETVRKNKALLDELDGCLQARDESEAHTLELRRVCCHVCLALIDVCVCV